MLVLANIKPGETVFDLGSGDGRVLIAAVEKYKAKAVGVEISPSLVAMATASRHPAVALAVATSGPLTEARPELAVILLYLVVATVVSIPYQKWRHRPSGKTA